MEEMSWDDAILRVLREANSSIHYDDIAKEILEGGLKTTLGKTPSNTVAARLSRMVRDEVDEVKRDSANRGYYYIGELGDSPLSLEDEEIDISDSIDAPQKIAIAAYGLYWERDKVDWSTKRLLGYDISPDPSLIINFADQQGVYILHSYDSVAYVGMTAATSAGLFQRLQNHHTKQVWAAKWERFSWFGIRHVHSETGVMVDGASSASREDVCALMESILIEALRPSFNQQQGNHMGTLYRQLIDPNIIR